jgi:hypothetical protein
VAQQVVIVKYIQGYPGKAPALGRKQTFAGKHLGVAVREHINGYVMAYTFLHLAR